MSDDAQKTPFVKSMEKYVSQMFSYFHETLGKSYPAVVEEVDSTNTIVTVSIQVQDDVQQFPKVKCPLINPQYIRFPIAKGQKGVIFSADAYLGGMSDIGGGVATLSQQANLTNAVFVPLGNALLSPTDDAQATVLYGPNGVVAKTSDDNQTAKMVINTEGISFYWKGQLVLQINDNGILLSHPNGVQMLRSDSPFGVQIGLAGTIIDGKIFLPHVHTNVQTGPNDTGPVG